MLRIALARFAITQPGLMRLLLILLLLIGAAGVGIGLTLHSFRHFAQIEHAFAGSCTPVSGVAGPEDMAIDHARGRVFISSSDRRNADIRGAIHLFDPDDPLAADGWRDVSAGAPEIFRPLGISYYEDEEVRRLFVINESNKAVELFDVDEDGALSHIETFEERRLSSPNSVSAIGPREFFVTNDVKAGRESWLGKLQFLLRSKQGNLLYFDGVSWRVAADGLRFANGVVASADGREVFVAETAARNVRVYSRTSESGNLEPARNISVPAAPDNLTLDAEGGVWAAGMPKPLSLPRHAANAGHHAPSAVMRIRVDTAEMVYLDDGSELSAATASARIGDKLIIGALFEQKFLLCDLPKGAF